MGQYSHMYQDRGWRRARRRYLSDNPICVRCEATGRIQPATIVDHIVPHNGDWDAFWNVSNWQALCKPCHDRKTLTEDRGTAYGRWQRIPTRAKPSRIPVHLVAGPPASGRTTYVIEHAGARELIIDQGEIANRCRDAGMSNWHSAAMRERNALIATLALDTEHDAAWIVISEPRLTDRRKWQTAILGNPGSTTIVLETPAETCKQRVLGHPDAAERCAQIDRWWRQYTADPHTERRVTSA